MTHDDEMRDRLLAERRALIGKISREEEQLHWLDEHVDSELVEEGQEGALALVLERLDEHDRAHLVAVEAALRRLQRGDYGRCVACGKAIAPARQRALPTADHCRRCAEIAARARVA